MPDLRRLGAASLALAVSFVAVLIFGWIHGQPSAGPQPGAPRFPLRVIAEAAGSHSAGQPGSSPLTGGSASVPGFGAASLASPSSASSRDDAARGSPSGASPPAAFAAIRITILNAGTLQVVLSRDLGPKDSISPAIQPGTYLVCMKALAGWSAVSAGDRSVPGWICVIAPLRAPKAHGTEATVTFRLSPETAAGAGG